MLLLLSTTTDTNESIVPPLSSSTLTQYLGGLVAVIDVVAVDVSARLVVVVLTACADSVNALDAFAETALETIAVTDTLAVDSRTANEFFVATQVILGVKAAFSVEANCLILPIVTDTEAVELIDITEL